MTMFMPLVSIQYPILSIYICAPEPQCSMCLFYLAIRDRCLWLFYLCLFTNQHVWINFVILIVSFRFLGIKWVLALIQMAVPDTFLWPMEVPWQWEICTKLYLLHTCDGQMISIYRWFYSNLPSYDWLSFGFCPNLYARQRFLAALGVHTGFIRISLAWYLDAWKAWRERGLQWKGKG